MAQLKSNIYYGLHNVLCGVLHGMSLQLRHLQRAGIYTMLLSLIIARKVKPRIKGFLVAFA